MHCSRRDVLKLAATAVGGALVAHAQEPAMHFPADARQRLAVTSYPFRAYFESPTNPGRKANVPGMDMLEFPKFVMEKFGVPNINPLGVHFRSTDPAYLDAFRAAVAKAGSHIVDFGLGGADFYDPSSDGKKAAVAYGCKWIDIAARLDSPSVRQHLNIRKGEKPQAEVAAEGLRQLAEYGAKRKVVINLENDNGVAEDPFLIVEIIEKVNSPYLRALPDFGNALLGHDEQYSEKGVAAMLGHVYNMCHVKDSVEEHGKLSKVNLPRMFELAKQHSYRGYFSMEFEVEGQDPITGTKRLIKETLENLV